jgi:cysteine desulfurase
MVAMSPCYLDWAAGAPPYQDIITEAAELAVISYGNPSSIHTAGKSARTVLENSRALLAGVSGTTPERITFTSGGTEADSIAMLSTLIGKGQRSVIISSIEHAAIFEQARILEELGITIIRIAPDHDGFINPEAVADAVRPDTVLVAVMAVNNETGAIQPVKRIADSVHAAAGNAGRQPFFYCDAVQALGTIGFDVAQSGVDGAGFSAHKLGGPRGIGALYVRKPLRPLASGGGQEGGIRPGTHNTPGAWAFAKAASRSAEAREQAIMQARKFEKMLLDGLMMIPGATPVPVSRQAGDERYSPYIVHAAFPGLGGEVLCRLLDEQGIAVSTGAACSSAKKERRILDAMGVDRKLSFSSIRISTGRDTTSADIDEFLDRAATLHARYRV